MSFNFLFPVIYDILSLRVYPIQFSLVLHFRLQFSFEVGILAIFGHLESHYREELKKNYRIVDKGYNSFPTSLPGTSYKKALSVSLNIIILHYKQPQPAPCWSSEFEFDCVQARKELSKILSDIISERKEKRLLEKNLLGRLLNSKDDVGQVLTDDQIADNIIGVLFAAQDTTASALTWIVKYLHDNPKLLEAVKVCLFHFLSSSWSFVFLLGYW